MNMVVLAVNNQIQRINAERTKLQLGLQKEQADAEYYRMVQNQYDNQRILIHDLKDHLAALKVMANNDHSADVVQYISKMELLPEFRNKIRMCDNSILNAILVRISEQCQQSDITFECDVRADCVSFFDAISITALFGNLLSNAYESAVKSKEREIDFTVVRRDENSIMVTVMNSCDEEPMVDKEGRFHSRKQDLENHGYGLKSIERVTRQYNGISKMYYDEDERKFHSIFLFPTE